MNRVFKVLGSFLLGSLAFGIVGCGESDELPEKPLENGRILKDPGVGASFEDAAKFAYNLGDRATNKVRQQAIDTLAAAEKKLKEEKPADLDKKLGQIQAIRERIAAMGEKIAAVAAYGKYVQPHTGPSISLDDAAAKLEKNGDKEYLRLRAEHDSSLKKFAEATKKQEEIAGEFLVKPY